MAGFPCIDFKATLYDGAYHDVDSSVLAFEIAARAAFREGIAKAGPVLLEPMMKVEVESPEDFLGSIIVTTKLKFYKSKNSPPERLTDAGEKKDVVSKNPKNIHVV